MAASRSVKVPVSGRRMSGGVGSSGSGVGTGAALEFHRALRHRLLGCSFYILKRELSNYPATLRAYYLLLEEKSG
jgi:hypothetical protein